MILLKTHMIKKNCVFSKYNVIGEYSMTQLFRQIHSVLCKKRKSQNSLSYQIYTKKDWIDVL